MIIKYFHYSLSGSRRQSIITDISPEEGEREGGREREGERERERGKERGGEVG